MKPFAAPNLTLIAPDDWLDASTYLLVGPKAGEGRASFVASLTRHPQDADPAAHISRQLPEIEKLPEFKLVGRSQTKFNGLDVAILEYTWKQPAGPPLRQRQWYIAVKGDIFTLTATAPTDHFPAFAGKFDDLYKSFKPHIW